MALAGAHQVISVAGKAAYVCNRCLYECSARSTMVRHLARKTPCKLVAPKDPEPLADLIRFSGTPVPGLKTVVSSSTDASTGRVTYLDGDGSVVACLPACGWDGADFPTRASIRAFLKGIPAHGDDDGAAAATPIPDDSETYGIASVDALRSEGGGVYVYEVSGNRSTDTYVVSCGYDATGWAYGAREALSHAWDLAKLPCPHLVGDVSAASAPPLNSFQRPWLMARCLSETRIPRVVERRECSLNYEYRLEDGALLARLPRGGWGDADRATRLAVRAVHVRDHSGDTAAGTRSRGPATPCPHDLGAASAPRTRVQRAWGEIIEVFALVDDGTRGDFVYIARFGVWDGDVLVGAVRNFELRCGFDIGGWPRDVRAAVREFWSCASCAVDPHRYGDMNHIEG